MINQVFTVLGQDCPMTQHYSPAPHDLADALGAVREEIKALKTREAELRDALLNARPNGPLTGRRFAVTVREGTRRSIDTAALPDAILRDARFWKTSTTRSVVTKAIALEEEDIMLIEPF